MEASKKRCDYPDTDIITVKELAEYLRIHPTSCYRLVNEGRIPAMRIGGTWRFKLSEVMKGLERSNR